MKSFECVTICEDGSLSLNRAAHRQPQVAQLQGRGSRWTLPWAGGWQLSPPLCTSLISFNGIALCPSPRPPVPLPLACLPAQLPRAVVSADCRLFLPSLLCQPVFLKDKDGHVGHSFAYQPRVFPGCPAHPSGLSPTPVSPARLVLSPTNTLQPKPSILFPAFLTLYRSYSLFHVLCPSLQYLPSHPEQGTRATSSPSCYLSPPAQGSSGKNPQFFLSNFERDNPSSLDCFHKKGEDLVSAAAVCLGKKGQPSFS